MPTVFSTLSAHEELLREKGYLDQNFKTATQIGYFLLEFQAQFEKAYQDAHLEQQPQKFMMDLWGKFNDYLDTVHYVLRYKYDPEKDTLALTSLHASLYSLRKTYYFGSQDELPNAQAIYDRLALASSLQNNKQLYNRLAWEFQRDRIPENDHEENELSDELKEKPHKDKIKNYPPNRLRLRPNH